MAGPEGLSARLGNREREPILTAEFREPVRYTHAMKPEQFTVVDPHYEDRVRRSFSQQGLMRHLGAQLTALKPGMAELRASYREELTQQHGYFHAGVAGSLADVACGYAAYTLMPEGSSVLTVEYKINLLAPADGEELIARARVMRSGRTLKICTADVFARRGETETHCATMLATMMCLEGKKDGR